MAEKLLKIGGVSDKKVALPIALSDSGQLKTNQFPSTSFYLGNVDEPVPTGHKGAYGVFGIEVLRTDYRGDATTFNRYQSPFLAKKGRYYFVSIIPGVAPITGGAINTVYVTMVNTVNQERITVQEVSYNPSSGGSSFPLTIIDLGKNIAVVNQLGVGTLYDASNLQTVKALTWDETAYRRSSLQLSSGSANTAAVYFKDSTATTVFSAFRLTEYDFDGNQVRFVDIETLLAKVGAYASNVRNFDANKKYFFLTVNLAGTGTNDGYAILVIKRSDLTLVNLIQSEIPRTLVPIAFASIDNETFYTVENSNGNIYKWAISGTVVQFDPTFIGSLNYATTTSQMFVQRKYGLTLVRTPTTLYLYDFDENKLLWSLDVAAIGVNSGAFFDDYGHVLFGDVDNNLLLVSQHLQIQGYGVNE